MANSRYEYVRSFEQPDILLANTWIVVRIDGRGFTKFTAKYKFEKPNDRRALDLMNAAAEAVMKELPDLCLAYGTSDEFSFVFHKDCTLFERRASKLTSTIVSTFTAYYTFLWPTYFPDDALTPPLPSFDGRAVCYPSNRNLRDYMSWRQVDCHINNLYNTTFWALVLKGGMDPRAAEQELSGTVSSDKNEILFSRFGINYNNEPEIFKKGSVLYRDFFPISTRSSPLPARGTESPTPQSHPRSQKSLARPTSQPTERTQTGLARDSPSSEQSTPRGPTFLSTSTTPSPPPSPLSMSISTFPFPQTLFPVPPPANGSSPAPTSKLPILTPIPLPPPTLKPSTKPPPSLSPPNPTSHSITSPQSSPTPREPIPARRSSHFASTSLTTAALRPTTAAATTSATPPSSRPLLKHRSPSLSILESQPPIIPLRISSIPTDNKPRKLSLQSQRSTGLLKQDEAGEASHGKGRGQSPPLQTMKKLPSPPRDEGGREEESRRSTETVRATNEPLTTTTPPRRQRSASHTRLHSAPPAPASSSSSAKPQLDHPTTTTTGNSKPKSKAKSKSKSKLNPSKPKPPATEEGGWAAGTKDGDDEGGSGAPREMSRTQRDKERKKRTKARIVIEHVDVIRDEFWERRPWILSGRTG